MVNSCDVIVFMFFSSAFFYGLTSCATDSALPPKLTLPTPVATAGPAIPFQDPNMHGEVQARSRPVTNTQTLLQCLAKGQKVYGLTLQNTNVRAAPQTEACRVGRIPRGSLVQILDHVEVTNTKTLTISVSPIGPTPAADNDGGEHIGYVEDVQPILLRCLR